MKNWQIDHERNLARAEARWLSLPKHEEVVEDKVHCDWCCDVIPYEETQLVADIGYRHRINESGELEKIGDPVNIKSRICFQCFQENKEKND